MHGRVKHVVGMAVGCGVLAVSGLIPAPPAAAYPEAPATVAVDGTCEGEIRRLHDEARRAAGRAPLREDKAFDQVARTWVVGMARRGTLAHNPSYETQIRQAVPGATTILENVGQASSVAALHQAWMGSSAHRGNITSASVQRVAVACVRDASGRVWATVNFVAHRTAIADRRPTPFRSAGDASGRLRYWLLAAGPTASDVEADAAKVLTDHTAADLAAYLATSRTHAGLVPATVRLYGGAFDREPDASGLNYWIRRRQQGTSLKRMGDIFAASAEFEKLYGQLGNRAFVEQVYRNVLDREPDATGTDYWVNRLARGDSRGEIIVGFTESGENKEATVIDVTISWAFAQMIDRMPTADERSRWRTSLSRGDTAADLVRWLAGTTAFTQRVNRGGF